MPRIVVQTAGEVFNALKAIQMPDPYELIGLEYHGPYAMVGVENQIEVSSYRGRVAMITPVLTRFDKDGKIASYGLNFLKYYFAVMTGYSEGVPILNDNIANGRLVPVRKRLDMIQKLHLPCSDLDSIDKTIIMVRALAFHTLGHPDIHAFMGEIDRRLCLKYGVHRKLKIDEKDKFFKKNLS